MKRKKGVGKGEGKWALLPSIHAAVPGFYKHDLSGSKDWAYCFLFREKKKDAGVTLHKRSQLNTIRYKIY